MANILIVGESCKDKFVYGKSTRLSPEAPVPVFQPIHTEENDGMAHNVAHNVKALGNQIGLISNGEGIIKTRYVDETFNHLIMRVDENDECERIPTDTISDLVSENIDAIIISDYDKGFLKEEDIQTLSTYDVLTVCDTKKKLGDWCKELDFIKLNRNEYEENKYFIQANKWIQEKMIITLDKEGCRYMNTVIPTEEVEIMDISGAGDTFVAGFTTMYLKSNDVKKSIKFANDCATEVVQKKGVNILSEKNI